MMKAGIGELVIVLVVAVDKRGEEVEEVGEDREGGDEEGEHGQRLQLVWKSRDRQPAEYAFLYFLDKAPRLSIRRFIWILASDICICICPTQPIFTNTETAMLSRFSLLAHFPHIWLFVPTHLLPVAAVLCVLLVAVAVGLAQLDQFEQIQQEGHLKHF